MDYKNYQNKYISYHNDLPQNIYGEKEAPIIMSRCDVSRFFKPSSGNLSTYRSYQWIDNLLSEDRSHPFLGTFTSTTRFSYGRSIKWKGRYTVLSNVPPKARTEWDNGISITQEYGIILNLNERRASGSAKFSATLFNKIHGDNVYGLIYKRSNRPDYLHAHRIISVITIEGNKAIVVSKCIRSHQKDLVIITGSGDQIKWENAGMIEEGSGVPCHLCHSYGRTTLLNRYAEQISLAEKTFASCDYLDELKVTQNCDYAGKYTVFSIVCEGKNLQLLLNFSLTKDLGDGRHSAELILYTFDRLNGKWRLNGSSKANYSDIDQTKVFLLQPWQ